MDNQEELGWTAKLARIAGIAYLPSASAEPRFHKLGFPQVKFIDYHGTQCYVAWNTDSMVIAFRGTEPTQWNDIKADLRAWLVKDDECSGRIHTGFHHEVHKILDRVQITVGQMRHKKKLYITGHSLGGALATLCAADIRRSLKLPVTMYNYGSPRVGNKKFKILYQKLVPDSFRFVNDKDAVPTMPKIAYHHVGNLCYMDNDGEIQINPGFAMRVFDSIQDTVGFMDLEKLTDHLSSHYRDQLEPLTKKVLPLFGDARETIEDKIDDLEGVVKDAREMVGKYV